jgi:hypothetical protein
LKSEQIIYITDDDKMYRNTAIKVEDPVISLIDELSLLLCRAKTIFEDLNHKEFAMLNAILEETRASRMLLESMVEKKE